MPEIHWRGRDDTSLERVDEDHPFPVQEVGPSRLVAATWTTTQVSVATTPTRIAAANPNRKGIVITQITGAQIVYLGANGAVSSATGMYLAAPAGSSASLSFRGEIWGVAAVAAQTVSVSEEGF